MLSKTILHATLWMRNQPEGNSTEDASSDKQWAKRVKIAFLSLWWIFLYSFVTSSDAFSLFPSFWCFFASCPLWLGYVWGVRHSIQEESIELSLEELEDKGFAWMEPVSSLLRAVKMDTSIRHTEANGTQNTEQQNSRKTVLYLECVCWETHLMPLPDECFASAQPQPQNLCLLMSVLSFNLSM